LRAHYCYEIRIEGHLGDGWKEWFEYLELHREIDSQSQQPVTRLKGNFPDQSALFGVLQKMRDLDLKLICVRRLDSKQD
jgi:hypothetical protein